MKVRFEIKTESYYNNGKIILNSVKTFEDSIRKALQSEEELVSVKRTRKNSPDYVGISANSLNKALRRLIEIEGINKETHVENGVFYHDSTEGFDFSVYDKEYNYSRLYNYYLGSVGTRNGESEILQKYKKLQLKKREWKKKVESISSSVRLENGFDDYSVEKEILTIVGELQFGNWGLIYRDLFRLLDADNNPGVDLYVYITADGELSQNLSDNTVSYKNAEKVIQRYLNIIKTPIWLIGMDCHDVK